MDALMLGSTVGRRTWFLARSDVFRKKALAKFLGFIGIIPIYRLLEGAENLSKNDETFEKCAAMLEENKAIMVFSEGLCIQERRLRKVIRSIASGDEGRLVEIPGMVPALHELPVGCKFADRCPRVEDKCRAEEPALVQLGASQVRCWFPLEAP